jgi:hypothetical protein
MRRTVVKNLIAYVTDFETFKGLRALEFRYIAISTRHYRKHRQMAEPNASGSNPSSERGPVVSEDTVPDIDEQKRCEAAATKKKALKKAPATRKLRGGKEFKRLYGERTVIRKRAPCKDKQRVNPGGMFIHPMLIQ